METLLKETLAWFDTIKRGDETIVILKREAPEALRDSVMQAHGDRLPDDWIYGIYRDIVSTLEGYDNANADYLEDQRHEIVDGMVDVYTAELTAWLGRHPSNVYYMTEAQEESIGTKPDGFQLLAMAQYKAIDEIYGEVASYLESAMNDEDDAAIEASEKREEADRNA